MSMKRPCYFYEAVRERLGVNIPKATISMVKSGRRNNDSVLMAVIEVDHHWKHIEHERLKRML